jgi:capsular polysaccharide biosynthesis protein
MDIMNVDAVNLVYEADVPSAPSGPSAKKNTVLAAIIGFVAVVGIYVVTFLLDDTIRTEEDVEKHLGLPTLGVIPVSDDFVATQGTGTRKIMSKTSSGRKK